MSDPTIQTLERLTGAPARLAVAGWLELEEKGLGDGVLRLQTSLCATVAFDGPGPDAVPIGVVAWSRPYDSPEVIQVEIAHVAEECRGSGVMSAMHAALYAWAMNSGATAIRYVLNSKNKHGRAVAERLQLREEAVVLRTDV